MISKKVLYSEQLLQLVLALSLLQVDPINYLEWGVSRIHTSGIGPWQLEIAHTPFSEYPYMNRKNYVPLIEDLARYDRVHRSHDVQAYLLNFDDAQPFAANATTNVNSTSSNTAESEESSAAAALVNLIQERGGHVDDIFLQSELFSSAETNIIDQNLADLSDYDDHQLPHFLAVPTKNEVSDPWDEFVGLRDGNAEEEEVERRPSRRLDVRELNLNATRSPPSLVRTAIIDWNDFLPFVNDSSVKKEPKDDEEEEAAKIFEDVIVKKEETDDVGDGEDNTGVGSSVELTVEEMDLIEVLWKQDVDLGYNPIMPTLNPTAQQQKEASTEDEIEKLKALLELKTNKKSEDDKKDTKEPREDPWAGLSYTIDTETGEYILQPSTSNNGNELDNLLLEEALQLAGISDLNDTKKDPDENKSEEAAAVVTKDSKDEKSSAEDFEAILESNLKQDDFDFDLNSPLSILLDESDDLDLLSDMMIQPSSTHFQHPRQPSQNYAHCVNSYRQNGYQGRVPLSRTVSMEQRWQDLANLLSFPPAMGMGVGDMSSHAAAAAAHYSPHHYPYQAGSAMSQHSQFSHHHHHPHSHPAVLHNASLAEIAAQPTSSHHYSSNLGSAVATSMHLTNSTSETDAGNSTYKMEHDMMYYSTNPTEMNHTNDGFLNSILNDEDLQLMDMAVNEGMYTMRMLDQNGTNSSAAQLNQALLGNHMQTNLSSGIGSSASSSQQHASGDRLDASSDSAVSSMGSERVASLSDGEWNEAGSDSAQEYHSRKFIGPYDYRFNNSRMLDANRQPVAQKKHQMYGKRFAHESSVLPPPALHPHSNIGTDLTSIPNVPLKYEPYEPYAVPSNNLDGAASSSSSVIKPPSSMMESEMKYSYSLDFPLNRHLKSGSNGLASHELINHNHTYTMPHPGPLNSSGATPRPQTRDKKLKKSEEEHMTRDEKRARALHIPISVSYSVSDIINLPMDEFNERLSKYDLSENQLSLIRDIRRRGKNKVAAQNCRKRKLDQIICLADEVKDMKMRKERFLRERDLVLTERRRVKDKFAALYRHVFTNLRDSDGNPYSSYQYSLQQSADGSVVLVPRSSEQNATENATGNASGSSRSNGHHHTGPGSNSNSTNFK